MGEEQLDFVFSSDDASYLGRVDLVATHSQPKRWLDVGAGHGHFCLIASDVLPDTRFDGLDLSDGIDEAERRQWVERGYRGLFTELADELRVPTTWSACTTTWSTPATRPPSWTRPPPSSNPGGIC